MTDDFDVISRLYNTHRSIRTYKPDPLPPGLIEKILEDSVAGGVIVWQPQLCIIDPYSRSRAQETAVRTPFSSAYGNSGATCYYILCRLVSPTREWLRLRGARDNFNNLLGYHVAAYDAMIVAQNVSLACEAEGLGICYMGTTLFQLRALSEFFELPDTCIPVTTIVVGYPDEDPAKRDRLPYEGMIHEEVYRKPDEAAIAKIYTDREVQGWNRYMSMPSLKARIEAEGITSLAQFYTSKIKYDPDYFAECSREIVEVLKEKGFLE